MNTTEVENFPGFRDGIMGPELMEQMRAQAERFGAELVTDDAVSVDLEGPVKTVTSARGEVYRTRAVVLATGSAYREPGPAERAAGSAATASRGAPRATASSSAARTSWSSAAATRRWRRRPS
ncbi:hypothetical protein GCM10025868_23270 [Angustibacter aerolatus]|uniref:FAD/NAD(P)-binding domain-containing protein n=1 Tax=Angustibacter aerolatus TaxID=1162965 RepID=A0ABQ6JJM4_9ACTN|nr:hypothetical protein [Angustibacter aerolatus]GMA87077.1 hypothetical protein GCM10025868_23270 [Angustibacter aerolatus]